MPIQVTAAIIVRDQKILVARRKPGSKLEGMWEFPGGKLDPNETPEACLTREIEEELGICDLVIERHWITTRYTYFFGEIELMVYLCKSSSPPNKSDAHDALEWAAISELSKYQWAPADIPAVQKLIQEGL
jgi:8-oxo-dGTP diphosphatase